MARLVLVFFLIAGLALAAMTVMAALRAVTGRSAPKSTAVAAPGTFQTVAYALLALLLFGLSLGWIGG